jgi:hypothetical protein
LCGAGFAFDTIADTRVMVCFREIYQRLTAKGMSKKLALIAATNKLLKQSLALAKSGLYHDENYRSASVNLGKKVWILAQFFVLHFFGYHMSNILAGEH